MTTTEMLANAWSQTGFYVVVSEKKLLFVEKPDWTAEQFDTDEPAECFLRLFLQESEAQAYRSAVRARSGIDDLEVYCVSLGIIFASLDGINKEMVRRFGTPVRVEIATMTDLDAMPRSIDTLWSLYEARH